MKRLLFIRHAKSSWKALDLKDIERPLNKRGKRDAPVMANRLKANGIQPDLIVCSPAVRTRKTANVFAATLNYPKKDIQIIDNIYEAMSSEILEIIKTLPNDADTVLMFGHNPSATMVANHFSNYFIDNIPTCGIFAVEFDIEQWETYNLENSRFLFFDYPKQLTE